MKAKHTLAIVIGGLLLFGVGCVSFQTDGSAPSGNDGGVFKTSDKGEIWTQKIAIPTVGQEARHIGGVDVVFLAQDPQDLNALYAGTTEHGMFYTYDGGESWSQPSQLSRGRVASVAIDPKDKCTVYATSGNTLLKTTDCSRTWDVTYLDSRSERQTTAVIIDHFNSSIIWTATDGGDVIKSMDAGKSWTSMQTLKSPIMKMMMSVDDSRRVFVGTQKSGVWRTEDSGENWEDLSENYREFGSARDFVDMVVGISDPAVLIHASKYGLIRSTDNGDTWESIELLTPPKSALVYTVAVDPKDINSIYYGTATTFYRSPNGGVNWIPKALPTTRTATALLVDSANSNVLYMGVTKFKN
ncbi:MAG: YCF48-related protein [Patescibacteria group bacterium]|nr:YCF48-related protein [Patescibacteria group bacterium]